MMKRRMIQLIVFVLFPLVLFAQAKETVPSRELSDLNWMEIRQLVPSRISTVILPTGTLEAHGVINNGADIIAPQAIAQTIAAEVNALVAPVVPYGITGSLDAYPGSFAISEPAYRAYLKDVISGMAKMGFKNIIVVNGHGGIQSTVLSQVATEVGQEKKVRTLVINWWTYTSDVTISVFGEDGGHAGWNENAFIQAVNPKLVKKELYSDNLAAPLPPSGSYTAYPSPTSIMLYKEKQGYVKFDQGKADEYFKKVCQKIAKLIIDTRNLWDAAGL
ncbi:MAG: creatininase family protein [bacterium]